MIPTPFTDTRTAIEIETLAEQAERSGDLDRARALRRSLRGVQVHRTGEGRFLVVRATRTMTLEARRSDCGPLEPRPPAPPQGG